MDWWIGPSNPTHDLWKWNDYHSPSHWKSSYCSYRRSIIGACHKLSNLWVLLCMQKYCCYIMWLHLPLVLHGYIYGEQSHCLCYCHLWEAFGYRLAYSHRIPTNEHVEVVQSKFHKVAKCDIQPNDSTNCKFLHIISFSIASL